jgi:hypothetical protein
MLLRYSRRAMCVPPCEPRRKSLWLAKLARSSHEAIADGSSGFISAAITKPTTQNTQPNDPWSHAESASIPELQRCRLNVGGLANGPLDHSRRIHCFLADQPCADFVCNCTSAPVAVATGFTLRSVYLESYLQKRDYPRADPKLAIEPQMESLYRSRLNRVLRTISWRASDCSIRRESAMICGKQLKFGGMDAPPTSLEAGNNNFLGMFRSLSPHPDTTEYVR